MFKDAFRSLREPQRGSFGEISPGSLKRTIRFVAWPAERRSTLRGDGDVNRMIILDYDAGEVPVIGSKGNGPKA